MKWLLLLLFLGTACPVFSQAILNESKIDSIADKTDSSKMISDVADGIITKRRFLFFNKFSGSFYQYWYYDSLPSKAPQKVILGEEFKSVTRVFSYYFMKKRLILATISIKRSSKNNSQENCRYYVRNDSLIAKRGNSCSVNASFLLTKASGYLSEAL